ncbi:transposase [Ahniella affigens]
MVHADASYIGADKRVKSKRIKWHIAQKRGKIKAMRPSPWKRAVEEVETVKARIHARVEHPFRVAKRPFGFVKVRFEGLAKNTAQVPTLFALANLWMARKQLLMMMTGELRPQFGK